MRPYWPLGLLASLYRVRLRLRLGEGVGGSVPVATPDSVHNTRIELQLSHATTLYRLRLTLRLGGGGGAGTTTQDNKARKP